MPIGDICNREVVVVQLEDTVLEASRLMRLHHVGDVVVVEIDGNDRRVALGIVTDRDIVMDVVAAELDAQVITVGDIMALDFFTIKEHAGVFETIHYMRSKGVRRLPVVDDHGVLSGIVTLEDLLALLSDEIGALSGLTARAQQIEASMRR